MKHYSRREFIKVIQNNGFYYSRSNGGHDLYYNSKGHHISVPQTLVDCIVRRLIKENNLKLN